MREYGSNINLPSLDNLFSSEQERQDAKLEKIQILPLTELHPFRNHPFQVRDDDEMNKMVDSVKEYGVMTPAIVRPRKDGGYEIVAGHRRCHASQRAGVETMPCIVRDMDDDTAIILMVDSNCQREHILPSEKAKAYQMKLEAVKRKAGRPSKINSGQVGQNFTQPFSVEKVADEAGESVKQVLKPFGTPRIGLICSKTQSRLKYNRQVNDEGVTVRGRFLVCGLNGDKVIGLSKDQADRYSRLLFLPQVEDMASGELPAAKVRPQDERYGNKLSFWERLER